jgi:hypothetical protein
MRAACLTFACLFVAPGLAAQAPGTDIYVGALEGAGTALTVQALRNVTARAGYDNQPSFTPDGTAVLYTAMGTDQSDIWRIALDGGTPVQVTHTAESEYSPTVVPDGTGFSVVRVEADSTQRLWRFALDGSSPALVLERIAPVGYHAWADATTLALFVLGDPPTLQIAATATGDAQVAAENIGRSLHAVPGREAVSFLHRTDDGPWITALDLASGSMERLAPAVDGNEYYAWTPGGALISGRGSQLLVWRDGAWATFADLSDAGVSDVSRIAVSPDGRHIAVVGADGG